ncbi:unnamed protein product [Adineta ricciae]|uniref:Uncharacterized protein n=1 Tax=Adineta ricciae TaxID=249248 RepID=A0A813UWC5_ADIRI|nr:unnamed protein product [Adineta ricciae]CAF1438286.1 unnamed protein product [Adineta ricciae]
MSKWQFRLLIGISYLTWTISIIIGLIGYVVHWIIFDRNDKKKLNFQWTLSDNENEYHTIIIGAGFSGLGMGIKLKEVNMNKFIILERHSHVGGTWYANRYPGCQVDVPSNLYSYSFEMNPEWSHQYSGQAELADYLEKCTDKYHLRSHIQFNTTVLQCDWLDDRHLWRVTTKDEKCFYGRYLIGAYGVLSNASYPTDIKGLETFQGEICHTAEWNDNINFQGKRVAVVGTGSSAVQCIPELQKNYGVEHLYVFQRTPPWVFAIQNRTLTQLEKKLYANFPFVQKFFRACLYWRLESTVLSFVYRLPLRFVTQKLLRLIFFLQVKDPQLREKLMPKWDYGCKRTVLSSDWYSTLQQPNVTIVTNRIQQLKPHSIVTFDGDEYPVDIIVWATGFKVHALAIPMFGIQGHSLEKQWSQTVQAYRGVTVPNFPNMFLLLGPNTGLGHNSVVVMIEAQFKYIIEALIYMENKGIRAMAVKQHISAKFNEEIQSILKKTVWQAGGCHSWYQDPKGNNTIIWPGFTWTYDLLLRTFDHANYDVLSRR